VWLANRATSRASLILKLVQWASQSRSATEPSRSLGARAAVGSDHRGTGWDDGPHIVAQRRDQVRDVGEVGQVGRQSALHRPLGRRQLCYSGQDRQEGGILRPYRCYTNFSQVLSAKLVLPKQSKY
jgi:hypothetical protein